MSVVSVQGVFFSGKRKGQSNCEKAAVIGGGTVAIVLDIDISFIVVLNVASGWVSPEAVYVPYPGSALHFAMNIPLSPGLAFLQLSLYHFCFVIICRRNCISIYLACDIHTA